MKTKTVTLFFLILTLLSITLPQTQSGIFDPFHTKEEKTAMWEQLWDSHTNTEYFSAGKSYNGKDILLFTAGNQSGGRVLWDSEIHGNEDKGSEILFLIAKWLLESNTAQANKILEKNYVMFIPMVNNQNVRGNGDTEISSYGVDLNRNFETGWRKNSPSDDTYSGPNPLSEPETRVMRNIFSTYQPTFYANLHCGAGPYASFYTGSNLTLSENLKNVTTQISAELGITPYRTISFDSNGYAIGDAVSLGVQSAWLIETVGEETAWRHLPEHYDELVNTYFPKCLAIFIAMNELSPPQVEQPIKILSITQTPATNEVHSQNSVTVQATIIPNKSGTKSVTLFYTINSNQFHVNMTKISNTVWTGSIPSFPQATSITYFLTVEDNAENIMKPESTENPSYTVLSDPQTPTPTTPIPTQIPTAKPTYTPTPSSPSNNQTTSPSQEPLPTPEAKPEKKLILEPIYPIIAALSIAALTLTTLLAIRKNRLRKAAAACGSADQQLQQSELNINYTI